MKLNRKHNEILKAVSPYFEHMEEYMNYQNPIRKAFKRIPFEKSGETEDFEMKILKTGGTLINNPDNKLKFDYRIKDDIDHKIVSMKDIEERTFVIGANGSGFPSIKQCVPENNIKLVDEDWEYGLTDIDHAMDLNGGCPNMMIMSRKSRRSLNNLLTKRGVYVSTELYNGFTLTTYNGMPIYVTIHIQPDDPTILYLSTDNIDVIEKYPTEFVIHELTMNKFDYTIQCEEYLRIINPEQLSMLTVEGESK